MCVFRLHWESFLAQFSALKLLLNATVDMGGVNQVTNPVQSVVCCDLLDLVDQKMSKNVRT